MPRKKCIAKIAGEEPQELKSLVLSGTVPALKLTRARFPLEADEGSTDGRISEAQDAGTATVERLWKRFDDWGA